jgi:hypothetical protein
MLARINSRGTGFLMTLSIFVVLVSLVSAGCGTKQPAAQPVVKKVDHITINCADPGALFNTFTQTLGLPAAWPLSSYPGFTTGGVYAGNVNIETLQFASTGQASPGGPAGTSIYGIVFESYPLDEVMGEFEQRGADPSDPQDQMREMNGVSVKVWTNVTLNALCTESYIVYLCEYTPEMQASLASRTQASSGPLGGIGLVGVKEISINSTQPDQTKNLWKTVFAPAPMSADGVMSFDTGPAVGISQGSTDIIESLVLEVASLQTAKDFLTQNGLLGQVSGDRVSIDPAKVQGLDIVLVEKN